MVSINKKQVKDFLLKSEFAKASRKALVTGLLVSTAWTPFNWSFGDAGDLYNKNLGEKAKTGHFANKAAYAFTDAVDDVMIEAPITTIKFAYNQMGEIVAGMFSRMHDNETPSADLGQQQTSTKSQTNKTLPPPPRAGN